MKVADVMTRTVVAVRPETPLKEVASLMVERGISGVPVVGADGAVVGVVSEADFVIKERGVERGRPRLLARLFGESRQTKRELAKIEATTAGEAMTAPAGTVEAADTLKSAAEIMAGRKINRLPVVEGGALVGMVTLRDVKQVEMEDWEKATVADIADRETARYALRPDHPAETLLNLIMKKGYSRLPVVDGGGRVVGIVSRRDLMETIKMMAYLEE
ncbi:MAG: CBS domain-containing protein [Zetaproteobacteria bacterium]|nr:MAG: CBS domain-containing protein [Zetaproteobacteria bacterium]